MRHAVFVVQWVFPIDQALLDERVEDAVDDVVEDESEGDEDWTTAVTILPHEDDLIDPEEDHPAALKSDEGCDRFRRPLMLVVAHYGGDQESYRGYHRDKGYDGLGRTVASLLVIDFVAAWARRNACVFMEVETSDTCQAVVSGAFARVAGFETLGALLLCR